MGYKTWVRIPWLPPCHGHSACQAQLSGWAPGSSSGSQSSSLTSALPARAGWLSSVASPVALSLLNPVYTPSPNLSLTTSLVTPPGRIPCLLLGLLLDIYDGMNEGSPNPMDPTVYLG